MSPLFPVRKPAAFVVLGVVKGDGVDRWQLRQQRVRHCIANSGDRARMNAAAQRIDEARFGKGPK